MNAKAWFYPTSFVGRISEPTTRTETEPEMISVERWNEVTRQWEVKMVPLTRRAA